MSSSLVKFDDWQPVIKLVVDDLTSEHSQRVYKKAIVDFLTWWHSAGKPVLSKAIVNEYRQFLIAAGAGSSVVNQRMSAVKKLVAEAADNGLIQPELANGISKVKGVKVRGVRSGNWLDKRQAERLINAPDVSTVKGKRDRAILALMIGAGLRRSEVAELTFERIQQREGRWVIVDLVGKGERVRSVPIPAWAKTAIDTWADVAGISSGRVFRGVHHYGHTLLPDSDGITPQAVFYAVKEAAYLAGLTVAPHDLRRTFAKLARKGGAELTQIQLTLGHSSVAVTQRYIGEDQSLTDAPCDRLGLDITGD